MKKHLVSLATTFLLTFSIQTLADARSEYDSETYGQMTRSLRLGWEFNDAMWVRDFNEAEKVVAEQHRVQPEEALKNEEQLDKMKELFKKGEAQKLSIVKNAPSISNQLSLALYYFDWVKLNEAEEIVDGILKLHPKDMLSLELQAAITKAKTLTTPQALAEFVAEHYLNLDKRQFEASFGPLRPQKRKIASLPEIKMFADKK